jgi:RHS repeat-associated protein
MVGGQQYFMSCSYNLAGLMTDETYPSTKVVHTEYDAAGRVAGVKNQAASGYYVGGAATDSTNRMQYAPHGALSIMRLGNGLWEHTSFNARLQPTQIGLGTQSTNSTVLQLDYTYGVLVGATLDPSKNNGNVQSQTVSVGGAVIEQSYVYDDINRLQSVTEKLAQATRWAQAYTFDQVGNRTGLTNSGADQLSPYLTQSTPAVSPSTNRINASGYVYDNAGNLKDEPAALNHHYKYDGENRLVDFNNQTVQYSYDGDGRRVKKVDSTAGITTVFVYNGSGQLIADYESSTPQTGGTSYLTTDHLASTRVVTDSRQAVKVRHDYCPFGEELGAGIGGRTQAMGYGQANSLRQKFTSKERDPESGLDYFEARYYSSAHGRFTSADPLDPITEGGGTLINYLSEPQHWHRYAYTLNNPLRYIDPDGLAEQQYVYLNIIWDKNSSFSEREKENLVKGYVAEANRIYKDINITFVVVNQTTGSAAGSLSTAAGRTVKEGATADNLNVFFTKDESLPSSEVTNTKNNISTVFLRPASKSIIDNSPEWTYSDLAHGATHAFGIAAGKNGYPNNPLEGGPGSAEHDVLWAMGQMESHFMILPHWKYDSPVSTKNEFMNRVGNTIRQGAERFGPRPFDRTYGRPGQRVPIP